MRIRCVWLSSCTHTCPPAVCCLAVLELDRNWLKAVPCCLLDLPLRKLSLLTNPVRHLPGEPRLNSTCAVEPNACPAADHNLCRVNAHCWMHSACRGFRWNRFAGSLSFIYLAIAGGKFIDTIEHLDLGDTHMEAGILPAFTIEAWRLCFRAIVRLGSAATVHCDVCRCFPVHYMRRRGWPTLTSVETR